MVKPPDFKGTNYLPSTALGIVSPFGMLSNPGTYWRPWVEQEIRLLRDVGFNSVRIHTSSFLAWAMNRQQYMANVEHLAAVCAKNAIAITWQFWTSTTGNIGSHVPTAFSDLWFSPLSLVDGILLLLRSYPSDPYPQTELGNYTLFSEPGPEVVRDWTSTTKNWESSKGHLQQKMLEYVGDIARFFGQHPVGRAAFGSYDLFNEPDVANYDALPIPLILATHKEVVRHHSGAEFTVGLAGPERDRALLDTYKQALGGIQTYWSFHIDLDRIRRQIDAMSLLSGPKVASEFWHTLPWLDQSGRMAELIENIKRQGWGGQMWGFLRTNAFAEKARGGATLVEIDGIVKPKRPQDLSRPLEFEVQHPNDYWPLAAWLVQRDRSP